jgi:acyl-coenzyme A synthetase/AMP-(fatty) acid ligase
VIFVESLPKTSNLKVRKAELKKWLSSPDAPLPWRENGD